MTTKPGAPDTGGKRKSTVAERLATVEQGLEAVRGDIGGIRRAVERMEQGQVAARPTMLQLLGGLAAIVGMTSYVVVLGASPHVQALNDLRVGAERSHERGIDAAREQGALAERGKRFEGALQRLEAGLEALEARMLRIEASRFTPADGERLAREGREALLREITLLRDELAVLAQRVETHHEDGHPHRVEEIVRGLADRLALIEAHVQQH